MRFVMEQLAFSYKLNEKTLREYFEGSLGRPISLTLTDNSTRMVSLRASGSGVSLRLHRIFLNAPDDILREVASFIKKRGKTPLLNRFLRSMGPEIGSTGRRKAAPRPVGKAHDLGVMFRKLNEEYFGCLITASVTWSKKAPARRVRRRTLGSFGYTTNSIRINPVLDNGRVPVFFVEFIVYHEMLHAFLGVTESNGRRAIHTKAFREQERLFRDYGWAIEWERKNRALL